MAPDSPSPADSPKSDLVITAPLTEKPGDRIGRYRLLEEIGHGGCGVVYMAEQEEPVRRRVALKVIKLGMDTRQVVARFEAERQALALMDHPNIAKVLDAGATETGRPYFVMELVGGIKITDYCNRNNLTTRERLDLFIQVCRAIQHAHQKGIIHRDIKPSNVLVTTHDGTAVPKVIDFGIAKATQGRLTDQTLFTAFEQFIGTPAYMSPEQAELGGLDIDTRSDIYSLGVLLYELLTGKTPFDAKELLAAGLDEMRRTIREKEPPKPSTRLTQDLGTTDIRRRGAKQPEQSASPARRLPTKELIHLLRGDLDWIVMKCLEKDRSRRYETANGLARDIERHLNQEPVVARPPSRSYRLHKFIRRNRVTAASATVIATVLVLAVAVSTWEMVNARRAERGQSRLLEEAQKARQDATEKLWSSYLAEARARRNSGKTGRRFESLAALRNAAGIRPLPELRNEAIACMVLADIQRLGEKNFNSSGELVVPDDTCERYAAADGTGSISIRRVSDDHELARLPPIGSDVTYPSRFSPDGKLVGFCYADHRLRVWDWSKSLILVEAPGYCDADFTPDSKRLATSDSSNVILYDLVGGEKPRTIPQGAFLSASAISEFRIHFRFHPDGRRLAVSSRDQTNVLVLDTESGNTLMKLPHEKTVFEVAWHPGGRYLATGGSDYLLYIWDTTTGELVRTLPCNTVSVTFSRGGNLLAASGWEGETHVWDFPSGRHLFSSQSNGLLSNFSPDDTRLIMRYWDTKGMEYFEVAPGHGLRTIYEQEKGSENEPANLAFSTEGNLLAYTTSLGIRLWDVQASREIGALNGQLTVLGFDRGNENLLLIGSSNLFRWPIRSPVPARPGIIQSAILVPSPIPRRGRIGALSANGRFCAIWGDDHCQVFRTDDFTEQAQTGGQIETRFLAVSPDGSLVACGSWQHPGVKVWDGRTGNLVKELLTEKTERTKLGTSVAFSPDGRCLVTAVATEYNFWDVGSWILTRHISQSGEYIPARMTFSHDGKILAGTVSQTAVRLYDAANGKVLADLESPNPRFVSGLSFNPDDTQLAVCGARATLHIWDLRLIRQQLAAMKLDWELPSYPPKAAESVASSAVNLTAKGSAQTPSR